MLLLLDNYDSFTYNVYQLMCELGAEVEVVRNDKITVEQVAARKYDGIVISPGPGVPADSGITESLIDIMKGRVPILGICVGMQMLSDSSEEGTLAGLGWIHGKVKKFDKKTQSN